MTAGLILICVGIYTLLLFAITWWTARGANNESYFVGNRSSNWAVVAYGMIGASLSGVTFMSVPGNVGATKFWYFQVVLGYLLGYLVIAYVLLPLYYRMNLTSIYTYLEKRFGKHAYRTGAGFFILSRVLGAACRMFIVVLVLQKFVFESFGVPFALTSAIFILLILAYTFKGGVKTIVWTDALQTTFMLLSLVLSVLLIARSLGIVEFDLWDVPFVAGCSIAIVLFIVLVGRHFSKTVALSKTARIALVAVLLAGLGAALVWALSASGLGGHIVKSEHTEIFNLDWKSGYYFPKAFLGGMFITITMTGLDQEMMQKNISCKTVGEAQKNMVTFSFIMVLVTLLFLALGALIWDYVASNPEMMAALKGEGGDKLLTDELFPTIALHHFGTVSALFFVIGLISAAYPSADGALTALTASFCIDFLGFKDPEKKWTEARQTKVRHVVHVGFAILLFIAMLVLHAINDQAIINVILFLASITYGPLLGLFAFGLLVKKRTVSGWPVVIVCLLAPAICFLLNYIAAHDVSFPHNADAITFDVFKGYRFGNELLILNGLLTFAGLRIISKKTEAQLL